MRASPPAPQPAIILTSVLVVLCALATILPAQAVSSKTHLLVAPELSPGGSCNSSSFKLSASFGDGATPARVASFNFQLLGGFNAVPDAPTAGYPWITGVLPRLGPVRGSLAPYTIHGAELNLGTATNVTIGGKPAPLVSRADDKVVVRLPGQTSPGWKDVTVTNVGGTGYLPRAVGILPMADRPYAIEIGKPFRITYRGTKGDIIYFLAAVGKFPYVAPVPPYLHGVEVNLGALVALIGPIPVTDPSGEFHIDFPGFPWARPIYVQFFGLPTANPGYAPGCFTNLLAL